MIIKIRHKGLSLRYPTGKTKIYSYPSHEEFSEMLKTKTTELISTQKEILSQEDSEYNQEMLRYYQTLQSKLLASVAHISTYKNKEITLEVKRPKQKTNYFYR